MNFFFSLLSLELNSLPLLIVAFQGFIKATWNKALSLEKQFVCLFLLLGCASMRKPTMNLLSAVLRKKMSRLKEFLSLLALAIDIK